MNLTSISSLMLGVALITLDIPLTSTAMPAIAQGLGTAPETTIWAISIYYLAVISALLPMAALGEIYGHRRVYISGLMVFASGALAAGLSDSLMSLMISRAVLGIGSAGVTATVPALIRSIYPPGKLARGLGLYAMVASAALTLGPIATSIILSVVDWPWIYFPSVPVALVTMILASRHLPHTDRNVRSFDGVSALLCATTFACILFAIAGVARLSWQTVTQALFLGLASGFFLKKREAHHLAPIFSIDLFSNPVFTLSAITSICAFAVQGIVFVVLPFLLTVKMGFSQGQVGFMLVPWPAALIVMPLLTAPLTERIAPGILGSIGLLILVLGLALLGAMPHSLGNFDIAWRLLLCGVGFGLFQSPNMVALISSAPMHRSGGAGGILAISRLMGQAIGVSAVAYFISTKPQDGFEAAIWFGCVLSVAGAFSSYIRLLPLVRVKRP